MHDGGVLRVDDLADLFACGFDDARMAVAGAGDADSGGEVEVSISIGPMDPTAGRVVDDNRGGLLEGWAEVGAGRRCHVVIVGHDLQIVNNLQVTILPGDEAAYRGRMTSTRVAVLGSINMDLTTVSAHLPTPGETVLGTSFDTSQGGKGANQALAAVRSGASTTFVGAVGDDGFGDELLHALVDAGVDASLTRRVSGPSGIAAIAVDAHGENTIVVVAGANDAVRQLTESELATIADADILLCQLEIPLTTVIRGAVRARAEGTLVMLNPSPVRDLPDELVEAVDILVVNEAEAAAVGRDVLDRIEHVVTTLGARGARYDGPESTFEVPSPAIDAVDTTGAGDAFAGALAAEWSSGPAAAIRWACAAGAFAATRRGAGSSSGSRSDIGSLL